MRLRKKLIIVAVIAVVILSGSISGVVLAADNWRDNHPKAQYGALLDRVCEIYKDNTGDDIDPEALKTAFAQARSETAEACGEMGTESMQNRLQNMVEQGKITQEQADELQGWWQSKPDVPDGIGFRGHGKFHGMRGMRGSGGPCTPTE